MGLRASFDVVADLGYPSETPELGLYIDYSEGCEIFVSRFLEVAQDLVPVDTGHLRSTISASSFGDGCDCWTDCDYAQYVEYGTYKMGAQPYFEPAIEAALGEAQGAWAEAMEEAMEEEAELLEEMEEEEERQQSGFGHFLGVVVGAAFAGIINGIISVIGDMLSGGERINYDSGSRGSSHGISVGGGDFGYGGGSIDIEIT